VKGREKADVACPRLRYSLMTTGTSLKEIPANSSHNVRKTNSAQPSGLKNIEVAHELSLQLHHGRKGMHRTSTCTRSLEDTI
jgi:hypothetical protein